MMQLKTILNVALGLLAGFVLAGLFFFVSRLPSGKTIELVPAPTRTPLVVHITGAVPRPGLYQFPEGSRIQDAISAAGGLLTDADVSTLNLASRLEDGQQLNIPFGDGSTVEATPVSSTPVTSNADLININSATLEELDALPGIGPTTAQKIIDYRTENGPFQRIEDIMNVSGIGPATFDKLKALISI